MTGRRFLVGGACALLLGGCATNGAVRKVETQVLVLRTEAARRDSAHAADIEAILRTQESVMDSLRSVRETVRVSKSELAEDLFNIQQQLLQIQELTGQSQRRLSELKLQLDTRSQQLQAPGDSLPGDSLPPALTPSADQMFQTARAMLLRGSVGTARVAFRDFLRAWPTDDQVPFALLSLGETFAVENPDSAAYYFREVATRYASSERAPTAWYKIGQLAEWKQDLVAARDAYQTVVRDYPRAPEANLARDRLSALRP